MNRKIPLFLFPGLACTQELYLPQIENLGDSLRIIVPEWLEPLAGESMEEFSARWGELIWNRYFSPASESDNFIDGEFYLGGLSFGGMIAPIIGDYLNSRGKTPGGCLIMAFVLSGAEIPVLSKIVWRAFSCLPYGGWGLAKSALRLLLAFRAKNKSHSLQTEYKMMCQSPWLRNRNVLRMIYQWKYVLPKHVFPIRHLHGTRDCLLPIRYTQPDVIIPDAGHCLSLTRPEATNDFIRHCVEQWQYSCGE